MWETRQYDLLPVSGLRARYATSITIKHAGSGFLWQQCRRFNTAHVEN